MKPVVYDTGVLIAADRGERGVWAEHRLRLEAGYVPLVPAPVVAQASRSAKQVEMRRFLRGCGTIAFDETAAHRAGALLGKSRTKDVVDAAVTILALDRYADIVTNDADDIRKLIAVGGGEVQILRSG